MRVKSTLPYEVWVSDCAWGTGAGKDTHMRFNARFGTAARAIAERDWYHKRGYYVELVYGDT